MSQATVGCLHVEKLGSTYLNSISEYALMFSFLEMSLENRREKVIQLSPFVQVAMESSSTCINYQWF